MKPFIQSSRRFVAVGIAVAAPAPGGGSALAQQGPGVTDTEIKIGAYLPLSDPIASYGIPLLAGMQAAPIDRQTPDQSMDNLRNYDTGVVPPVTYSARQHSGTTALQRVQISGGKWNIIGEAVDSEKEW